MTKIVNLAAESVQQRNIVICRDEYDRRIQRIAHHAMLINSELFNIENVRDLDKANLSELKHRLPKNAKQQLRKEIILETIMQLGFDPLNPPMRESGKSGMKCRVREALKDHLLFESKGSFDKTWEKLSEEKKVTDKT